MAPETDALLIGKRQRPLSRCGLAASDQEADASLNQTTFGHRNIQPAVTPHGHQSGKV